MAKPLIKYYDEAREFNNMENCAEKIELAVSRMENPYNITVENRLMYQTYLEKEAPKAVPELIDANRIRMFPLLVKYRTVRKANITKFVDYAQTNRKMDILSYLLNASNEFRIRPKAMGIAPKFVPGKSDNNETQVFPDYDSLRPGDIIWMGVLPMPWQVLDKKDGKVLVISKYVIDCQAYHSVFYKVHWNDTSICKWLDREFAQNYFSDREKQRIQSVYLGKKDDSLYMEEQENTVENKLFFLSIPEAEKYFRTEDERRARITSFGKRKIMWASFDVYAHWWLRTYSTDPVGTCHVTMYGDTTIHGGTILSNAYDEFYDHYGVRPAMYINL